ncbi:MAG: SDR family oxidoreductase [Planctomycetota bacterium]|nr:SDR family oxidoreductase [Planctomycetota bacterium]
MSSLFNLEGQVAVVIGGTGGLGGAMADALAASGAKVAVVGRNAERGAAAVERIAKQVGGRTGETVGFYAADAIDKASLESACERIHSELGSVRVLVNAAGGNRPDATLPPGADFCALGLEAWRDVFDLNLVGGVLLPCQVFGKKMLELVAKASSPEQAESCSIINIASMSGMIPLSRVVAYSAAKAAVLNLTQFLSREWATRGVRVNAISPGFFPAEQNRGLLYNADGSLSARGGQIIGHTPMSRFGRPEELAGATVFLASAKASSFVTGQNIVIDGGFSSTTI